MPSSAFDAAFELPVPPSIEDGDPSAATVVAKAELEACRAIPTTIRPMPRQESRRE